MNHCFDRAATAPACPVCHSHHRQTKAGRTGAGTQRYQCQDCKRCYCIENRHYRYSLAVRQQAARLHASGISIRQVARMFSVNHQTVANWISVSSERQTERDLCGKSIRAALIPVYKQQE